MPEAAVGDATAAPDGPGDDGSSPADGPGPDGAAAEAGGSSAIACGNLTCSVPAQTCCVSFGNGGVVTSCANGATCPGTGSTTLRCASSADCTGQSVCCLTQQNNGGVAECSATCGGGDTQLCDPTSPAPGCGHGQQCQAPNGGAPPLPTGIGTCGG
jgi:hypothetical protein